MNGCAATAARMRAGRAVRRAEARERHRQRAQRDRVGRDRAAVGAAIALVQDRAGHLGQCGGHAPHRRMLRPHIARRVLAARAGEADEAGMLARAVVVQRPRRSARRRQRARRSRVVRPVRAAFQAGVVASRLRQHRPRRRDMQRLAAVRGAGQRDLRIGQTEQVRRPARHQRQRLQRLHRRAREHGFVDVAGLPDDAAAGIDDRQRAAMGGFAPPAARHLDQDRVHPGGSKISASRTRRRGSAPSAPGYGTSESFGARTKRPFMAR